MASGELPPASGVSDACDTADAAPLQVGAYRLGAPLAAGGFGVVYRAEHVERGTAAALKIMHPELAGNQTAVLRFQREVEAIRRIQHPGVIEVFDCGSLKDGRPYLAMELLSGRSLGDHLRARGRLPVDEVIAILEPLCGAIAAAHAQAIVHRDLKASNVFLCDEGGRMRVVLLDFGVAKLLDAEGPGLTSSRHIVGTPACMAPEQILGKPVDARTDVYALGALTYRMLTGELPFPARSRMALHQMHLYAIPRPPSARAPVSQALDEVVLRALSKAPEARQPTVDAFLSELLAAARTRPASERRGLAVFIEIQVDPAALEDPSDHLMADMESVLPFVAAELAPSGFKVALETGTSMLLVIDQGEDPEGDAAAVRARALEALRALYPRLLARPGRDSDVQIRLCAHMGSLVVGEDGKIVGGELLDIASWVPEAPAEGLLSPTSAFTGMEVTQPLAEENEGTWE